MESHPLNQLSESSSDGDNFLEDDPNHKRLYYVEEVFTSSESDSTGDSASVSDPDSGPETSTADNKVRADSEGAIISKSECSPNHEQACSTIPSTSDKKSHSLPLKRSTSDHERDDLPLKTSKPENTTP